MMVTHANMVFLHSVGVWCGRREGQLLRFYISALSHLCE